MSSVTNVNFHQTFKPESQYISSILSIADNNYGLSLKEISQLTGIPQGESSGKVEPHIVYSSSMGLIEYEKKDGLVYFSKTDIGEIVSIEDPGLQEELTKLMLHAMMLRDKSGTVVWKYVFRKILPKYHGQIKKDLLLLELNELLEGKINTKNIAPFYGSYDDFFKEIGILSVDESVVECNSLSYNREFIYLYALVLLEYWEELIPDQNEISSTQFTELCFGKVFGWDSQTEYDVLEHMVDKGFIRLNRQLMPYTILKLVDKKELIEGLYSELC